ncbi:MAG: SPFH/Band 7/PHB domain protein [Endomicrobium sp.]|jgi:regulator of protease activity HflC (stomatin/prohibitin superfamily)|nr:SPFH/Band 7/PHB domain protein [Endomicrobium sp.]MDR2644624.1 SPFH/Band 7/PHB domain protein [Endomicrobium sp.]
MEYINAILGMGDKMTIFLGMIAAFAVIFIANSVKIIKQYEKGLIETLGKYTGTRISGANIIIPIFQRMLRVDMRERVIDVPPQSVITKDNVSVVVDAIIYFQVTDPVKVVYNIENFALAALKLAQTNLRNVIGDMELDSTLTSREKINTQLRVVMDEATDKWGVKVTRVEIQKIDPPKDITDAMSKQMKAEREKRANILEAEGLRQAAILKAEGAKQAVILDAEAVKEKQVLEATGEAEAIRKVAEAEKYKIEMIYKAIHEGKPTNDLIAIKYLEALGKVADGQATKVFLPLETAGVTASLGGIAELFKETPKQVKTNN